MEQHSTTPVNLFDISAAWTDVVPGNDSGTDACVTDVTADISTNPCDRSGTFTIYSMKGANIDGNDDIWLKYVQPDNGDEDATIGLIITNVTNHNLRVELRSGNTISAGNLIATSSTTGGTAGQEGSLVTGDLVPETHTTCAL